MTYIKWLRLRRGLTQAKAADMCMVSVKTWSNYENDHTNPRNKLVARRIAHKLCGQFAFVYSNMNDRYLSASYDKLMCEEWFGHMQCILDSEWGNDER